MPAVLKDVEYQAVVDALHEHGTKAKAAEHLGLAISTYKDRYIAAVDRGFVPIAKPPKASEIRRQRTKELREARPEIDTNDKERVRQLEAELARMREQAKWLMHSDAENVTGGTLTIRRSDDHFGDDNHLLSCAVSLTEKTKVVIDQFKPSRIQCIMLDDWIAGRGIFKEQDAQMAVPAIEHQINIGAMKARKFMQAIRSVTDAPVTVFCLRGNHEHANKIPVGTNLFYACRTACEDMDDITWVMRLDRAVVNLAHMGTHNVLAMHGYGHSQSSPNSPRFISDVKNAVLKMQRKMMPAEQIQRILSGHTHWMSVGLEREDGMYWDTTGGLQRNNRVQLGMNARPSGWIIYVSPPGVEGEILNPIGIKPDSETYERELEDPYLDAANKRDCGELLEEHAKLMRSFGILGPGSEYGLVTEGRW